MKRTPYRKNTGHCCFTIDLLKKAGFCITPVLKRKLTVIHQMEKMGRDNRNTSLK